MRGGGGPPPPLNSKNILNSKACCAPLVVVVVVLLLLLVVVVVVVVVVVSFPYAVEIWSTICKDFFPTATGRGTQRMHRKLRNCKLFLLNTCSAPDIQVAVVHRSLIK